MFWPCRSLRGTRMSSPETREHTERLDTAVLEACDAVGVFIEYWGFKNVLGRVWALLVLHKEPLTQVTIAERLDISRSLVSSVIAELVERGLVRPVTDHRNSPYEAQLDVWPTIAGVLKQREWLLLEQARNAFELTLEEAELIESANQPYDVARLRTLLNMTEVAQSMVRMLITIRVPSRLDVGEWIGRASALVRGLRGR